MLSAVPSVGLADASECRPQLSDAFAQSDVVLQKNGEVKVALRGARPFELSLMRGAGVVLRRELNGTCDEAARATVVVVGRWLSTLGPPPVSLSPRGGEGIVAPGPTLAAAGDAGLNELMRAGAPNVTDAGTAPPRELRAGGPAPTDAGTALTRELRAGAPSATDAGTALTRELRAGARSASDSGILLSREPSASDSGIAPPRERRAIDAATSGSADAGSVTPPRESLSLEGRGGLVAADAGSVTPLRDSLSLEGSGRLDAGSVISLPRDGEGELVAARIGLAPAGEAGSVAPRPDAIAGEGGGLAARPLRLDVTHLEALVGGGVVTPSTPELVGPALSLELALHLNERVRIGLLGVFDFGGSTLVLDEANRTRGRLTTRGGLVAPTAQLCFELPLRLCGGVLMGARIAEGQASGTFVFGSTTARTAAFTVGPTAQLAWVLSHFHLALDLSLLVTPTPPTFQVDGLTSLTLPVAQGLFRLSIGIGSHETVASSGP